MLKDLIPKTLKISYRMFSSPFELNIRRCNQLKNVYVIANLEVGTVLSCLSKLSYFFLVIDELKADEIYFGDRLKISHGMKSL